MIRPNCGNVLMKVCLRTLQWDSLLRGVDNAPLTREDSPGASKRIRIDRDKAKRDRGGSRMLANAMKSANDEKPQ
jgi:hypothetical protein